MRRLLSLRRFGGSIARKNGEREAKNDEKRHKIQNGGLGNRVKLFHDSAIKLGGAFFFRRKSQV